MTRTRRSIRQWTGSRFASEGSLVPMDDRGIRLATTFADVARALLSENDLDSILGRIAGVAVAEVNGCESAGIDLIEKRVVRCVAWTSAKAERMGDLQNEVGEGPCLSAIREHETFRSDDLESEDRWPKFAARARQEMGVRSMLGYRLFAEEDTMGALNLHSSKPNAFDEEAMAVGSILAAHAAIAMSWAREREYMNEAIENRDVIGQAGRATLYKPCQSSLMSQGPGADRHGRPEPSRPSGHPLVIDRFPDLG